MAQQVLTTRLALDGRDFQRGLGDTQKTILKFSAAATGAAAAATALAKQTANYRDETMKAARASGVQVEEFSALRVAADRSGVSLNRLTRAMTQLQDDRTQRELEAMGVATRDAGGAARDSTSLMADLADEIQDLQSPAERTAALSRVLGTNLGPEMASLLAEGSAGLEEAMERAEELGRTFDQEAGEAAERFNDRISDLGDAFGGLRDSFGAMIIDFADGTGVVTFLTDAVSALARWIRDLPGPVQNAVIAVGALAAGLGVLLATLVVIQAAAPALGAAMTVALGPVGVIIMAVGAAFAALAAVVNHVRQNWERFRGVFEPAIRAFQRLRDRVSDVVDRIRNRLQPVIDRLREMFGGIMEGAEGFSIMDAAARGVALAVLGIVSGIELLIEFARAAIVVFRELGKLVVAVLSQNLNAITLQLRRSSISILQSTRDIGEAMQRSMNEMREVWNAELGEMEATASETMTKVEGDFGDAGDKSGDAARSANKEWGQAIRNIGSGVDTLSKDFSAGFAMISEGVQEIEQVFNAVMSDVQDIVSNTFDRMENELQATTDRFTLFADVFTEHFSRNKQREIDEFRKAERAKIDLMRDASRERLAIIDHEFAAQMRALEQEMERRIENIRLEGDHRKAEALEAAQTQQQAVIDTNLIEEDVRQLEAEQEQEFQERIRELEAQTEQRRREEEEETAEAVAAAEERKAESVEEMNQRKEDSERELARRRAAIEYALELAAFSMSQQRAKAMAKLEFAQALVSAVSAGLQFGIAAPVMIPVLMGLATASFATSMSAIAATPPPMPPAELFLREGGRIHGPAHRQGGVRAELEGGERVLDVDTNRQFERLVDDAAIGGQHIEFHNVVLIGKADRKMVEQIADQLGKRVERVRGRSS